MRQTSEVLNEIQRIEKANSHILNQKPADIAINAPVALMQVACHHEIKALYWSIKTKNPKNYVYFGGKDIIK